MFIYIGGPIKVSSETFNRFPVNRNALNQLVELTKIGIIYIITVYNKIYVKIS